MIKHLLKIAIASLCVTVCFAGTTAFAASTSKGGVIHACVLTKGKKANRGLLRIVGNAKACKKRKGQRPIAWNVAGPAGPQGSQGPAGATGPQGETGPRGATGSPGEVDKSTRETITDQASQISLLNAKVGDLTKELLSVEVGVDGLETDLGTVTGNLGTVTGDLGTLTGTVGTLNSKVGEACGQLKTVTGQSNLLGTAVTGVNNLIKTLLPIGTNLPAVPTALSAFECK